MNWFHHFSAQWLDPSIFGPCNHPHVLLQRSFGHLSAPGRESWALFYGWQFHHWVTHCVLSTCVKWHLLIDFQHWVLSGSGCSAHRDHYVFSVLHFPFACNEQVLDQIAIFLGECNSTLKKNKKPQSPSSFTNIHISTSSEQGKEKYRMKKLGRSQDSGKTLLPSIENNALSFAYSKNPSF